MIQIISQLFIGFSSGIAVGAGFVAVLTMLGIVPRLLNLGQTPYQINWYTLSLVLGTLVGSFLTFTEIKLNLPFIILPLWGLFHGLFIGMVIAALAEVLNVYPIIAKRIGLSNYVL